jgi:hypothetical protein
MRVGGWQRVGIVASVVWFVVGGLIGNHLALEEAGRRTTVEFDSCVNANKKQFGEYGPYDQVWTPCWQQHGNLYSRNAEGHWWIALLFALTPIPIGWLIGWLLIGTGRWIRRGFGHQISN